MTDEIPGWTNYSASEAVDRAESYGSWQTNMCMNFVWYQLSYAHVYGIADAYAGWDMAHRRHDGADAGDPPAGAPVYWSTDHPYGHVALSTGGGMCRSTDWPSKGKVGTVGISELSAAWGMELLGWTEDLCGDSIAGLLGDDDMPLTDDEIDRIARAVWAHPVDDEANTGTVMVRLNPGPRGIVLAVASAVWDHVTTLSTTGANVTMRNLARWTHQEAQEANADKPG